MTFLSAQINDHLPLLLMLATSLSKYLDFKILIWELVTVMQRKGYRLFFEF